MKQYTVTGMSCAACSSRVEKAVSKVPGVTACSGQPADKFDGRRGRCAAGDRDSCGGRCRIWRIPERTGHCSAGAERVREAEDALKDRETPVLKHRLIASLGFLISPYVYVDGTYDVGLAAAALYGWQPCGDGTVTAPFSRELSW